MYRNCRRALVGGRKVDECIHRHGAVYGSREGLVLCRCKYAIVFDIVSPPSTLGWAIDRDLRHHTTLT